MMSSSINEISSEEVSDKNNKQGFFAHQFCELDKWNIVT